MRARRILRRFVTVSAVCVGLALGAQSSHADHWYPGLPDPDLNTAPSWGGASQAGLSYAKRAKQWFRTPDSMVTFTSGTKQDPMVDGKRRAQVWGRAHMVSPKGAPEPYGYMAPVTVRSVGFGLMPVEATVQVSQRRANGFPIAMEAVLDFAEFYNATNTRVLRQENYETVVEDAFNVEILNIKVDGLDIGLTGNCRTVEPAPVRMVGPAYTIEDPRRYVGYVLDHLRSLDPSEYFSPLYGGQLTGTITIPAFTGCTTKAGDDLSALMTLSVSGAGNPVSARVGWPCVTPKAGVGWPLATGQDTPKLASVDSEEPCAGTKKFDYPERPAD